MLLLLILPIKVIYDVPVESKAMPHKEWRLLQDGEQFRTQLTDLSGDEALIARNFVFERGDVVDIEFKEGLRDGSMVDKDELLLQFRSMMHTMRIQRALNDIDVQESLKLAGSAAMKAPLMAEAKDAVALAEANVKLQEANQARLDELLKDGVISQAELDAQTNRLEVARQELGMAQQRLVSTTFEVKPEELAVFSSRIQSIDKELDVLLAQQHSYTVQSPFSGRVALSPEEGVVLSLSDTLQQTLIFPFPIQARDLVEEESYLTVETEEGELRLPFYLKNEVGLVRGEQRCLGMAHLDSQEFSRGEVITAKVVCDTVLLRDYILRKLL